MKIIELLPKKSSLFETILVTLNDVFVDMYLKNKINYYQISENILKFIKLREFQKYKLKKVKNIQDIIELNKYVRLKINTLGI